MTKRTILLLLSAILVAAFGFAVARQLGFVAGSWGGSGTASVELVLEADGAYRDISTDQMDKALEAAREIIAFRVDALRPRSASVSRSGATRIIVRVEGIKDPAAVRTLAITRGRAEFRLVDMTVRPKEIESGRVPLGSEVLPWAGAGGDKPDRIAVLRRAVITDSMIEAAQRTYDAKGAPAVQIKFTEEGARRFAQVTAEHVRGLLALVLDDVVLWVPAISEPINGGEVLVTGKLSFAETTEIATLIGSGALPLRLSVVEENAPAGARRN